MTHAAPADFCIVTPALNKAALLANTIDSVLRQEGVSCDYRVIDGDSQDDSKEILKRYAKRVRSLSEPDSGQFDAINKGFAGGSSAFMGILNADDLYLPGVLADVKRLFEQNPHIQWIAPKQHVILSQTGKIVAFATVPNLTTLADILMEWKVPAAHAPLMAMSASGVFWRRELWEKAGGRMEAALQFAGELELWCSFLRLGAQVHFSPTPTVALREQAYRSSGLFRVLLAREVVPIFEREGFRRRAAFEQYLKARWRTLRRSLAKRGILRKSAITAVPAGFVLGEALPAGRSQPGHAGPPAPQASA